MKNKFFKVLSLVVVMALMLGTLGFAAEEKASMSFDKETTVDAGETFYLTLAIDNGKNVKSYAASEFKYDKHAFELVNAEVIKIGEPAIAHYMNEAVAATYIEAEKDCSGEILKIEFKVKETAKGGEYLVSCAGQINREAVEVEPVKITVNDNPNAVEPEEEPEIDLEEDSEEEPEYTAEERAKDVICLKIDEDRAFAFGEMRSIDENNDKVVPYIYNDRTLVPLRFVSETLGADVLWEDGWDYCYVNKGDKKIKITFNSADIEVNGEIITYDAPIQVVEERTMVPIRFISETLGYNVHWNEPNKAVVITPLDNPWDKERQAEETLLTSILVTYLMF